MVIDLLLLVQLLLALGALALMIFVSFIMFSFRHTVPFVPTPRKIINRMIDLADIMPNERICDLGSGTGRIIFKVAKYHRQNLIVGIEKSLTLRLVSRFFRWFYFGAKKRIQIVNQDFFNIDLFEYDVIFCFLTPEALRLLTPKFQALKPGSRIISYMFALENQQGFIESVDFFSEKDSIYYYKKLN